MGQRPLEAPGPILSDDRVGKHCAEVTGEPLTIWSEQGFGDAIMFARYYKHIVERAPSAILEVQAELYELFDQDRR
jgi:hypothetical protein